MKIIIKKKHPTSHDYYECLNYLLDHGTRSEIVLYLDMLVEYRKRGKENEDKQLSKLWYIKSYS